MSERSITLSTAPVHAYWDAIEADIERRDREARDLLMARLACRDEAWSEAPENLRALGIDSPEVRWKAARVFMRRWRAEAATIDERWIVLTIAAQFAEDNAVARGAGGWVSKRDLFNACARIRRLFGDDAARIVTSRFPAVFG